MTAIEIRSLRKEYKDVVAVDDLSLAVTEGELFSLLGVEITFDIGNGLLDIRLTFPFPHERFIINFEWRYKGPFMDFQSFVWTNKVDLGIEIKKFLHE